MNDLNTAALISRLDKAIQSFADRLTTDELDELIAIKEGFENIESDTTASAELKNKKRIEQYTLLIKFGMAVKDIIDHFI